MSEYESEEEQKQRLKNAQDTTVFNYFAVLFVLAILITGLIKACN